MQKSSATLLALLSATLVMLAPVPATADAWYPQSCDTVDYCAAVDNVAWARAFSGALPRLVIASRYGQAAVLTNFTVHESKDGLTHVCMRYDPFGGLEVSCLMVPARRF